MPSFRSYAADVHNVRAIGDRGVDRREGGRELDVRTAVVERIGRPVDDGHHREVGRTEHATPETRQHHSTLTEPLRDTIVRC